MAFAPKPVAGSKLYRKTGPSTYALIEGLEGLEISGGTREKKTVRPMNATSPITLTGAIGEMSASGTLYYNPSDAQHAALATAFANNTEETFKLEQSDSVTFYFKAYVASQLKFPSLPPDGVIQYPFELTFSSERSDTEL